MRGALAVRINDGRIDRHVTRNVRGLKFRKTAPGGYDSASMTLNLPISTFPNLGPADRCWVYDARTGETVFEGQTDTPNAVDGSQGQSFDELSVLGTVALLSDRAERFIYLDTAYDQWRRDDTDGVTQAASAGTDVSSFPDTGNPALVCQFNPGQPISSGAQARMLYDAFKDSPMELGGFAMTSKGGANDSGYAMEWVVPGSILATRSLSTTGAETQRFASTDFPAGYKTLAVRLRRSGTSTTPADDNIWAGFGSLRVVGQRVNRYGQTAFVNRTGYVLASEVVEDLVGRILTFCDPFTAVIEPTTAQIDQLAFMDATTAVGVLDELAKHDDFDWGVGKSATSGKKQFWFRAWPSKVRHEVTRADGYRKVGAEFDQCNRLVVEWKDTIGRPRSTPVTAVVPELDEAERVKDAERVTLPDGWGSETNAQRIGAMILKTKVNPPKAATAVVGRPIRDLWTGHLVMPWEIEPGCLVRVRETGDVLRLTAIDYDDDTVSTTLTLGRPLRSDDQLLADAISGRRVAL